MCCLLIPPIPVAADRPLHKQPTVTYTLIAVEAAVYLTQRIVMGLEDLQILPEEALEIVIGWLGYTPSKAYPWSFYTYAFLHGGLMHLLGNLLSLWMFGAFLEERLGKAKYLGLIALATPAAVLGHVVLLQAFPTPGGADTPLIGASGYILGILGAFLVLMPSAKYRCMWFLWFLMIFHVGRVTLPAAVYIPVFVLWDDIFAVLRYGFDTQTAHGAHLGGAALGLVLAAFVRFTPKSQRAIDRQLREEHAERLRLAELGHRNFREALDRGAADAAVALVREGEKEGRPLPLTLKDRVRLAQALEAEGEGFLAGQTYKNLLAGDLLNREQRLEIGLRLARILLNHERNLEATKELLRTLHREHQSDPRHSEIVRLVEQVQEIEKNLYKRPR